MRTICRTMGQRTSFVVGELSPAYHQAARDLYYSPVDDGFAKAYPADTPHLGRIYRNFERRAEEMILQMAGVRPVPWDQALLGFFSILGDEPVDWWLAGSGALAVRGLEIAPRDLDIITDDVGAQRLGVLLLDYLVEPVQRSEGWISNWFGRAFLHARLEWVGGVHQSVDQPLATDFGAAAASRLETVSWHGKAIRVPPLDLQLQVSERRGLTERADRIKRYLMQRE